LEGPQLSPEPSWLANDCQSAFEFDPKIEVAAETLEIDPIRAVPLGLLVNELTTTIEHAFPGRMGRVLLSAEKIGD
jgi:two-component sensor histidine kinase